MSALLDTDVKMNEQRELELWIKVKEHDVLNKYHVVLSEDSDIELFDILKSVRLELAKSVKQPPYTIQ